MTLVLRGGADQFIAETERSVHDAIMIVKRSLQHDSVVGGISIISTFVYFFSEGEGVGAGALCPPTQPSG